MTHCTIFDRQQPLQVWLYMYVTKASLQTGKSFLEDFLTTTQWKFIFQVIDPSGGEREIIVASQLAQVL